MSMHHRTLTLALAVPLCCLAHRHAAGQPAKAADRVEQGRELLAQGDLAGAQEQFAAELAAGPQGERRIGDVNFYLGLVSQRQAEQAVKDPQAAEKLRRAAQNYFREATKWRSDSAGSWHNLALVSDRLGDAKTADDAFRRAIGKPVRKPGAAILRNAQECGVLRIFGEDLLSHASQLAGKFEIGPLTRNMLGE